MVIDPRIDEARRALGVKNLLVGVHDPAFPTRAEDDVGRGSPYGAGGRRFLEWARSLGFDGVQLGPQGLTSSSNASPYDGTIFSTNPLSIDLRALVDEGLLARRTLDAIVASKPEGAEQRVPHAWTHEAINRALDEAHHTFLQRGGDSPDFQLFLRENAEWLERDALYEVLCTSHRAPHWSLWPDDRTLFSPTTPEEGAAFVARRLELADSHATPIDRYAFAQWIVHRQHEATRAALATIGVKLFGDLQIGVSEADSWSQQAFFLRDYRMGAPPSRTHPLGQAWNYRVYDPDRYDDGALRLVRARLGKMLRALDGVRIDHPHGLVCPWVYRPDHPRKQGEDELAAVRAGARLFSSPDLADHPALARFSIARADQIDRGVARWAEGWVRELDDDQIDRYGRLFDVLVDEVRAKGRTLDAIACEVLSTQPYQLRRVIDRHGLGRFRVTQKVDLADAHDVYRSENARPEDWILIGNHDTRSIWSLVDAWAESDLLAQHAAHLAARLQPRDERSRKQLENELARDRHALAQAKCAELFASPAQNVMIFFTDLLGEQATYNEPGTTSPDNWSLRIAHDFDTRYETMRSAGRALDIKKALAAGLHAKGLRPDLVAALSL